MNYLKSVAGTLFGILIFIAFVVISFLFIKYGVGVTVFIYPILDKVVYLTFFITVILIILSFINKFQELSLWGIFICSYVFGLYGWIYSFLVTYAIWGFLGVFIGLCLMGVGIVPIALLATLINTQWVMFLNILISIALTYGSRMYSLRIAAKIDNENSKLRSEYISDTTNNFE